MFSFFAPRPGFGPFLEVVDYEDLIGVKAYQRAFLITESGKRISIEARLAFPEYSHQLRESNKSCNLSPGI